MEDAGPGPPGWARALARRRAPGTVASLACAAGLLALGAGRRGLGWRGASAEAPAGVLFGQKEAHEADGDVQKAACDAVNAVFAKVVVPKLNSKTIPQTIDKIGYNPMQQVVSSESMQVTDLTGLINFTITSLTASKVVTNSSVAVSTGFSTTATAYMEMEASVPVTMTAHAELEKGGKSGDKSEQKSHRRRLEDSSNSSDVEFDGTANIKNLKVKMPITGVVTITSGSSLNASNIVANMKHMTIESAKSGIPDIGFDLSLQCQRRLKLMDDMAHDATDDAKKGAEDAGKDAAKDTHMECHTASVGLEAAKPAIDLVMDDKFTSIIQNVLNKQLPMTLGEPKDENKVSGSMKIDVSGGRRLSPDADPSSAASAFLANNTTKLAVDEALAELANIPSSGVSTNFVLDERGGIDYFYNLSTPGGDADAYDVREVLMNHSDEEVSDKITQHLWNYDASWDVRASVAYASVVEPFRWRLGSDEPDHAQPTPWRKWWPQISILAAVLLVGLVAMLTRCSQGKGRTRAVPQLGADRRPRARGSPAGAAPGTPQRRAPPLHTSPAAPAPPVLQGAATPGPGSFLPPPGPVVQGPAQYGQQVPGPVPLPGGPPGFSYGQLPSYVQPQSQYHVQGPWPPPQNQAAVVHMQPQSPYSQSQPSYSPGYAPCPAGAASGCGGCGGAPVLWGGYGPVPAGPLR